MGDKQAPVILLADDENDIRDMIGYFLKNEGFQVYEARDGLQAVEMAERIQPNLILMDLSMPHLDGESAAKQIRYLPKLSSVPIIFMTAFGTRGMDLYSRIDTLGSGPIEYLPKPIHDLNQLLELIRSFMKNEGITVLRLRE
jgi:two-component system alkaline phosphatase synthesis response regulator PhoP